VAFTEVITMYHSYHSPLSIAQAEVQLAILLAGITGMHHHGNNLDIADTLLIHF
jgi:hypothetical protein